MKSALIALVAVAALSTGCKEKCNLYHGIEDGRADAGGCNLKATFQEHCPTPRGKGGDYLTGYELGFCQEASDECMTHDNVYHYCENVAPVGDDTGS